MVDRKGEDPDMNGFRVESLLEEEGQDLQMEVLSLQELESRMARNRAKHSHSEKKSFSGMRQKKNKHRVLKPLFQEED